MGSTLLVLASERTNRFIREPGETTRLQFRELGVIPSAKYDPQVRQLFKGDGQAARQLKQASESSLDLNGSRDLPMVDPRVVTLTTPRSLMAEAFRSTSLSISEPVTPQSRSQVLVVTSPHPKSGKSTTVSNLAVAMAEFRQNVLIIDGDLRRPRLHDLFGLPKGPGWPIFCMGTSRRDWSSKHSLFRNPQSPGCT